MTITEASIIDKHFAPLAHPAAHGFKDDAAHFACPPDCDLVVTTDTIVAGTHFLADDPPVDIAAKAIAVNRSDLIAKGAAPEGYLVSITLPDTTAETKDDAWFSDFAAGLAKEAKAKILGGDLTVAKGPLSVTVTAIGSVPTGFKLMRSGANVGDGLYVGGEIGMSHAGLRLATDTALVDALDADRRAALMAYFRAPVDRDASRFSAPIREHATASLDVSDGLVLDAERLAAASGVSIEIEAANVPLPIDVRELIDAGSITLEDVITGGDDYVPLITAPDEAQDALLAVGFTRIGSVGEGEGVSVVNTNGEAIEIAESGYDHLADLGNAEKGAGAAAQDFGGAKAKTGQNAQETSRLPALIVIFLAILLAIVVFAFDEYRGQTNSPPPATEQSG